MQTILKISDLCKSIGKRRIINHISFETYGGEVFGFLGPNGAGKTTTIKMIFGLLDHDHGSIQIDGIDIRKHFEKATSQMGGIVENPETYTHLTGMQNLRQYARMRNGVTDQRIREVVRIVGLEKRIDDKVKKYSLGMKQRLGLAQAILHKPKLLILDEPTNGLDPAGIRDLRDILKDIAHQQGASVFVSSHLLSEMELMCDRVGIIANGRMLGVRTTAELMQQSADKQKVMRFTVNQPQQAIAVLQQMNLSFSHTAEQTLDVTVESEAQLGEINNRLIAAGIMLLSVAPLERSLEDVFIEITGGGNPIA